MGLNLDIFYYIIFTNAIRNGVAIKNYKQCLKLKVFRLDIGIVYY